MNDEPLPVIHGYPARLIIPGLYGYVSATKWLAEIEMTTLEAFDGYWIPLGWSKLGPILTQSRIDVPRNGQSLKAGPRDRSPGVAWAPDRGISKVEVSIDQGPWLTCTLSGPISKAVWVQWRVPWTATPGRHIDRGPGDRRDRRRADRRRHATRARRRARPSHDRRLGELSRTSPPRARRGPRSVRPGHLRQARRRIGVEAGAPGDRLGEQLAGQDERKGAERLGQVEREAQRAAGRLELPAADEPRP